MRVAFKFLLILTLVQVAETNQCIAQTENLVCGPLFLLKRANDIVSHKLFLSNEDYSGAQFRMRSSTAVAEYVSQRRFQPIVGRSVLVQVGQEKLEIEIVSVEHPHREMSTTLKQYRSLTYLKFRFFTDHRSTALKVFRTIIGRLNHWTAFFRQREKDLALDEQQVSFYQVSGSATAITEAFGLFAEAPEVNTGPDFLGQAKSFTIEVMPDVADAGVTVSLQILAGLLFGGVEMVPRQIESTNRLQ